MNINELADDNNPLGLRPGLFVLNLGFFRSFTTYLFSYEQAVELLYSEVASGRRTADAVGPPLVFLMRQSVELGYKFTVFELYRLNPEDYAPDAFNQSVKRFSHSLSKWHTELNEAYVKIAERFGLPDDERAEFAKYYEKTRLGMEEFERLDEGSFSFRFPTDKAGKLMWSYDEILNLLILKSLFDQAMTLLRHTADVLEDYLPEEYL